MHGKPAFLSALLNRLRRPAPPAFPPLPRFDPPICVVGDLHGRLDLLERLLQRITAMPGADRARIIFVGDLIDRGPDSAGVLKRVQGLTQTGAPGAVICLMGNHERMMLDFLDDAPRHGARWVTNGGAETLAAFGISPWQAGLDLAARADTLRRALPPGQEAWLRAMPLIWQAPGLAVVHAGADPDRALDAQSEQTLLWGHPAFLRRARSDGIWVAHGHTIVAKPHTHAGRIAIDTGAWRTGRLSAAWIGSEGVTVFSVTASEG